MKVIARMADIGLPSSISDAGVAALAARAAVMGAFLNVKINCGSFADKAAVRKILDEGLQLQDQALTMERDILDTVNGKLSPGAASSSGT
jgi:glutamate formiminotransferase/formiminotetrahydrofolate cyclodeaminase